MNGHDVEIYENCKSMMKRMSLTLEVFKEKLVLYTEDRQLLGWFDDVKHVQTFLHGYEWGWIRSREAEEKPKK